MLLLFQNRLLSKVEVLGKAQRCLSEYYIIMIITKPGSNQNVHTVVTFHGMSCNYKIIIFDDAFLMI